MNHRHHEPDFGATGQFDVTGVFPTDAWAEQGFAHTLSLDGIKNMVLIGTGLAHRHVLTQLCRHQRQDMDVVLIAPSTSYAHPDLLRGWIAGHHDLSTCCTDLLPWVQAAHARWIPMHCTHIDPVAQQVQCGALNDNPSATLSYDVLSLESDGQLPSACLDGLWPGASAHALAPQASAHFIAQWTATLRHFQAQPGVVQQVCVFGAHHHAIEWALAVQQGLAGAGVTAQITLLTAGEALGWDLPPKLQHRLKTVLTNRGVRVREDTCIQIEAETLTLGRGTPLACDLALIPTGIESHPAVYRSALQHDTQGRVLINNRLQSLSHPQVFAVGALSHWEPRGNRPPVAHHSDEWGSTLGLNLMAYLSEQPLSVASFETTGPMVVDCGDQTALMQWGPLCAESHWTWKIRTQRLHAMLTS